MKVMAAALGGNKAQRHSPGVAPEAIHRGASKLPSPAKAHARAGGWADPGERVALKYVAVEARCRPILDIGVGAGRTTELLRAISRDYIGIDDNPGMVDFCRSQHPDAQISHMDARDLSRFDDNHFALVLFSFNGIDAVSLSDRRQVLREVGRVLQPHGLFAFSAHNREAIGPGELPGLAAASSGNSAPLGKRTWQRLLSLPISVRDYVRERILHQPHDDRAIMQWAAHHFGTLGTYSTLPEQKQQLREAGLQTELVLDNLAGRPVADDADTTAFAWLHYVARKV